MRESDEDVRLGQLLRAVRRRSGLTQADLVRLAGVPRNDLIDVEAGRATDVKLGRIRQLFAATGGRARLGAWWNGAAADRLLDERHAALVERALAVFSRFDWQTSVEVTFNDWGERGSIDLFAAHQESQVACVCEIKSVFGSLEATNRSLDIKVRLAPKLSAATFGWRPAALGRLLIVPANDTIRRAVARHQLTMTALYPARTREVRAWIRQPRGPLSGVWFLAEASGHRAA